VQVGAEPGEGAVFVNIGDSTAPSADERSQEKTCPRCGARFECMAAQKACWCAELTLSKQGTADLRERFTDCLCSGCIALFGER
jgi:hypothetical protein